MGKSKLISNKSLQFLNEEAETASPRTSIKSTKNVPQVFLQQSVTLLAFKDKAATNGTVAPDVLRPKVFFGIVPEDLPLFIGAVIGASLVIALFVLLLAFWKCCCGMTVLSKKKQYWLQPKNSSHTKGKYKIPVVQSNSVVFLGLRPSQAFDYKRERSSEDCIITKFAPNSRNDAFDNPLHYTMSGTCPEIIVSGSDNHILEEPVNLVSNASSDNLVSRPCSVISISPMFDNRTISRCTKSTILSPNDVSIPDITIHQDSPDLFHRSFHSGTFDQSSLYSCESHMGSELDFKNCSFTWSNNLRTSSASDCYYDLFQKVVPLIC